ncbi:MAG: hypothetical protein GY857_13115 [Desulfobacula sp.]|nr:hypothetical protein [Desulfobacula sp.]
MKQHSLIETLKYKQNSFYMNFALYKNISEKFNTAFPFQVLDNSDKLARVIQGEIRLNKTIKIKKLLLLVQRDNYLFEYSDLNPVTNSMLDKRWHHLISSNTNSSAFHFTNPKEYIEEPYFFKSLFYCQKIDYYFHPPCPTCAAELELCMDDELLKKNALPSYSNSLKRYLYCPKCILSSNQTKFYTYSKEASDPGYVKNRFDLIHDFKNLKANLDHSFPCSTCQEHMECYMTGEKADNRISFFSFYPFHMMCFNDSDMTMEAFLPLISGASIDEIDVLREYGITLPDKQKLNDYTSKKAFFFNDSPMFFLEVLYLKLSLLRETARIISIRSKQSNLYEFELSFKKLWIKLGDKESVLPCLWNFSVNILDVPDKKDDNQDIFHNQNFSSYFALLWLYIFFSNKNQRSKEIFLEAGKIIKQLNKPEQSPIDVVDLLNDNKIFQSHQIFWNNPLFIIPSDHIELWNKIVTLFFSLSTPGSSNNTTKDINNVKSIIDNIDRLMDEIKEKLFNQKYIISNLDNPDQNKTDILQQKEETSSSKQNIHNILSRIKQKWEHETGDYDNDIMETFTLSTPVEKINKSFADNYNQHPIKDDTCNNTLKPQDNLDIALSDKMPDETQTQIQQKTTQNISTKESGFDSDLEKTVILTSNDLSAAHEYGEKNIDMDQNKPVIGSKSQESLADNNFSDQDMEKTVIIVPEKLDNKPKGLK